MSVSVQCIIFPLFAVCTAHSPCTSFPRYQVMLDCWLSEPGLRPTFPELVEKIGDVLQEGSKGVGQLFTPYL